MQYHTSVAAVGDAGAASGQADQLGQFQGVPFKLHLAHLACMNV